MALRDQPYIPLFIQDIMTDEKLNECCASTHGIYIKGIMCLMHKSNTYGKILLKQKYKQTESISLNFGLQISKHTPYSPEEISDAITELLREDVCQLEGDYLCQKRMIKDNQISEVRSNAGKKGGGNPNFVSKLVKTNLLTNTENETANETEFENNNELNQFQKSQFTYDDFVIMFNKKRGTIFTPKSIQGRSDFIYLIGNGFTKNDFELVLDNCVKDEYHLKNGNIRPDILCKLEIFEKYRNWKSETKKQEDYF